MRPDGFSLPKLKPTRAVADTSITSCGRDIRAIFFRRRHQPRRPAPPNSSPGSPAPTIGPGTATGAKTIYAVAQLAMQVDRVTQILFRLPFPREIMAHVGPTRAPKDRTAPGGVAFLPGAGPLIPALKYLKT